MHGLQVTFLGDLKCGDIFDKDRHTHIAVARLTTSSRGYHAYGDAQFLNRLRFSFV